MARTHKKLSRNHASKVPAHPLITDPLPRDTLDRVADVIELLEHLDLSNGLTPRAQVGLYWVHRMLLDSVKHVSDNLG